MTTQLKILTILIGFATLCGPAKASEEIRVLSSEARSSGDFGGNQAMKYNFDFGETKAWLREDGYWQIEGDVAHRSGFCATYQLGIRFGTGNPGCSNAEWINEPLFVTRRFQCNNAGSFHVGGEFSYSAQKNFDAINCAQRVLKCSGACK